MICPNCQHALEDQEYQGLQVKGCLNCGGMWFTYQEIDQLEDEVFDQDDYKNTLVTDPRPSSRPCPVCSATMQTFRYRWEELELETCPQGHGFWLDKNEADEIPALLLKYEHELDRTEKVEESWKHHLQVLQSPSFFDRLKRMFGGE